jgi:hypothetical protein
MTTATFNSDEYGKIEVKRCNSVGDWSGVAYFFGQDYETDVDADGRFVDACGRGFQVFWAMARKGEAILDVIAPRTIGRAMTHHS